jgi:hypothetical protein
VAAVVAVSAAEINAGNGYMSPEALLKATPLPPTKILSLKRFPQRRVAGILELKSAQSNPER